MSVTLVLKHELRRSLRNRELPGMVFMLAFVYGALGLFYALQLHGAGQDTIDFLTFPVLVTLLLAPMVGLLLGNNMVSKPREDGRLRLMFGQPVSRTSVFLGGYLARATVVALSFAAAAVTALAVASALGAPLDTDLYLGFTAFTCLLALAYLGISVSVSAVYRTTSWTTFTVFSVFVVFVVVWRFVPDAVVLVTGGLRMPETTPAWTELAGAVSPSVSYEVLIQLQLEGITDVPGGAERYTDPTLYVVLLAVWIVVLPAFALWRFRSTDL